VSWVSPATKPIDLSTIFDSHPFKKTDNEKSTIKIEFFIVID
jgi:hypothetical protein